ncbi:hypothetical protein TNCV_1521451 [Trichonephila clavipes]|nr:hypothetical protein TNCV_1521451 [Trichonephila clavipes]
MNLKLKFKYLEAVFLGRASTSSDRVGLKNLKFKDTLNRPFSTFIFKASQAIILKGASKIFQYHRVASHTKLDKSRKFFGMK